MPESVTSWLFPTNQMPAGLVSILSLLFLLLILFSIYRIEDLSIAEGFPALLTRPRIKSFFFLSTGNSTLPDIGTITVGMTKTCFLARTKRYLCAPGM